MSLGIHAPKTKQCANPGCLKPFTPARPLQSVCSQRCAKKLTDVRKAKEKNETKARKEALQTIPELIKIAQREFNAWTRERDKDKGCISCGRTLRFSGGTSTGGDFDCGHFRSTGSAPHLRFDERNAHGQCKHCNRYLAGNVVSYRKRLALRIGLAEVEALEADNSIRKWTREELKEIAKTYRDKRKQLEKEHG